MVIGPIEIVLILLVVVLPLALAGTVIWRMLKR